MKRFVQCLGIVSLCAASAGCFPGEVKVEPRDASDASDAGADVSHDSGMPNTTLEFTLDYIGPMGGLNLDGLDSTTSDIPGCNQMDRGGYTRAGYTVPNGVDNQMMDLDAALGMHGLPSLMQSLSDQTRTSKIHIAMRLARVDDLENDPDIEVEVFVALPTFGTDCTNTMARSRSFAPWNRGSARPSQLITSGRIVNGTFSFETPRSQVFYLPVLVAGKTLDLPLRQLSVIADVGSRNSIGQASVGARINSAELYAVLTDMQQGAPALSGTDATDVITRSHIDVQVGAQYCDFAPGRTFETSGDISIGFGYDMNHCEFTASVTTPSAGTCYSM